MFEMGSRVAQVSPALRFVRCLVSSANPSCSVVVSQPRPSYTRLVTTAYAARKQRSFSSGSSENVNSQNDKMSRISIESTEFTNNVDTLAKSFGLTQNPDVIVPALIHKSYLIAHASTLKRQYKDNDRLAFLGLQTSKRFLTELLFDYFPHLSAQELWDTQNGILENQVQIIARDLQLEQCTAHENTVSETIAATQSLMAIIAVVYIHEGPEKAKTLLHDKFVSNLDQSQIQEIIKLQHPKYTLRCLSQQNNDEPVKLRFLKRKLSINKKTSSTYKVGVFKGDQCMAVGTGSTADLAEKKACQNTLCKIYPDELRNFSFSCEAEDFESEDKINLGLVTSQQHVITLEKGDEEFGFNVKGGEEKKLKNKEWLVYNYFSPIFISSIKPDGLAGRLRSLRVGDVVLAVNDKSLVGLDHARAVKVLKEVSGRVTLTVKYSKEVLITDRVETEYKKLKQRKRLAELTSEVWAEWHQAQADKHPEKYADVLDFKEDISSQ